jgi:hypothetical protein
MAREIQFIIDPADRPKNDPAVKEDRGGAARLRELGISVQCVLDIYDDLGAPRTPAAPTFRALIPKIWDEPAIERGLHPALAARRVAERYLARGLIPRPPDGFDADYDGRGGVFISIRDHTTNKSCRARWVLALRSRRC